MRFYLFVLMLLTSVFIAGAAEPFTVTDSGSSESQIAEKEESVVVAITDSLQQMSIEKAELIEASVKESKFSKLISILSLALISILSLLSLSLYRNNIIRSQSNLLLKEKNSELQA